MFLTGSPEESKMLLRELSETALLLLLLLLLSLVCCSTTIAISSDNTSDGLGVEYGLDRVSERGHLVAYIVCRLVTLMWFLTLRLQLTVLFPGNASSEG